MPRTSSPVSAGRQAASDASSAADVAQMPMSSPLSARATSPRLQANIRFSELTGSDHARREPITGAATAAATIPAAATPTFDQKLTEWEWSAPEDTLPHERWSRREAAHRMRCVREDDAAALNLHDLYMSALPPFIAELTSVKRLDAGCNNLESLPELPADLTHLYLHGNYLTHLPRLPPALVVLEADHNHLTQLPVLPPALARLLVHANPIARLPHLPWTLQQLSVQADAIGTTKRALEEKIATLDAALQHLPPPLTGPAVAPPPSPALSPPAPQPLDGFAAALARLRPEMIGKVSVYLAQDSTDAANLSTCGKSLHAVVQPGIDIARKRQALREQLAILNWATFLPLD